jgi:hypothetical protein
MPPKEAVRHRRHIEMEPRFDKNIDALLRQPHLKRGVLLGDADHLDADQIAAFAANAIPDSARPTYFAHLADCSECRESLAAVIMLSAEDESAAAAAAPLSAGDTVTEPWYRGLFRAPGLAFGMGALVLVFSGFIGYLVLQNGGSEQSITQVAMPSGETARGPMAPEEPQTFSNAAAANTAVTRQQANTNANTSGGGGAGNLLARREDRPGRQSDAEIAAEMREREVAVATPAPPPPKPATEAAAADAAAADEERDAAVSARRMEHLPVPMGAPAISNTSPTVGEGRAQAAEKDATQAKRAAGPPAKRIEGGKAFELRGNVWYDESYRGQSVTDVRRSTSAYRSLDSGLRAITDKISGTVVIVWNDKAYRIR